jgi:hypothetical protein
MMAFFFFFTCSVRNQVAKAPDGNGGVYAGNLPKRCIVFLVVVLHGHF